jgi:hypothetical protein
MTHPAPWCLAPRGFLIPSYPCESRVMPKRVDDAPIAKHPRDTPRAGSLRHASALAGDSPTSASRTASPRAFAGRRARSRSPCWTPTPRITTARLTSARCGCRSRRQGQLSVAGVPTLRRFFRSETEKIRGAKVFMLATTTTARLTWGVAVAVTLLEAQRFPPYVGPGGRAARAGVVPAGGHGQAAQGARCCERARVSSQRHAARC